MATPNLNQATSNLPQTLVAQTLPSSSGTLYTGPTLKSTVIATAVVANTSASTRTVTLSVTKASGGTARLCKIELEADESCVVDELIGWLIAPGDVISGFASAGSAVDIAISGAVSS